MTTTSETGTPHRMVSLYWEYLRILLDRAQGNPEPSEDPQLTDEAFLYATAALDGPTEAVAPLARSDLMAALEGVPLTRYLNAEARGKLADAILEGLPAAAGDPR